MFMKKFLIFLSLILILIPLSAFTTRSASLTLVLNVEGITSVAFTQNDITADSYFGIDNPYQLQQVKSGDMLSFYGSVATTELLKLQISYILPNVLTCQDTDDTVVINYLTYPGDSVADNLYERTLIVDEARTAREVSTPISLQVGSATGVTQGEYTAYITMIVTAV